MVNWSESGSPSLEPQVPSTDVFTPPTTSRGSSFQLDLHMPYHELLDYSSGSIKKHKSPRQNIIADVNGPIFSRHAEGQCPLCESYAFCDPGSLFLDMASEENDDEMDMELFGL